MCLEHNFMLLLDAVKCKCELLPDAHVMISVCNKICETLFVPICRFIRFSQNEVLLQLIDILKLKQKLLEYGNLRGN